MSQAFMTILHVKEAGGGSFVLARKQRLILRLAFSYDAHWKVFFSVAN